MPRGYALHTKGLAQAVRRVAEEEGCVPGAVDAPTRVYTERSKPSSHPNTPPHQDRHIRLPRHLHHDGEIPHTEITLVVLRASTKSTPAAARLSVQAMPPQHQKGRNGIDTAEHHRLTGALYSRIDKPGEGVYMLREGEGQRRSSKLITTPGSLNQQASQSVDIQGVINTIGILHKHNR